MRRTSIVALLALLLAAPSVAQTPPLTAPAPTATTTQIDPAHLALATSVVDKVFPLGTYKRMMGATMDRLMDSMMDTVGAMPIAQLSAIGGLSADEAAKVPRTSLAEVMAMYDPSYRERSRLGMHAMMEAMTGLMTSYEPKVREGLSRAYARKFSVAQLRDLDAFFHTSSGSFYAAESMGLYMDPELMREMQAFAPEMIKQMPEIAKKAEAATAALPKPRKIAEMTPAERTKLANLLGVRTDELTDPPSKAFSPGGTTP